MTISTGSSSFEAAVRQYAAKRVRGVHSLNPLHKNSITKYELLPLVAGAVALATIGATTTGIAIACLALAIGNLAFVLKAACSQRRLNRVEEAFQDLEQTDPRFTPLIEDLETTDPIAASRITATLQAANASKYASLLRPVSTAPTPLPVKAKPADPAEQFARQALPHSHQIDPWMTQFAAEWLQISGKGMATILPEAERILSRTARDLRLPLGKVLSVMEFLKSIAPIFSQDPAGLGRCLLKIIAFSNRVLRLSPRIALSDYLTAFVVIKTPSMLEEAIDALDQHHQHFVNSEVPMAMTERFFANIIPTSRAKPDVLVSTIDALATTALSLKGDNWKQLQRWLDSF